MKLPQRAVALLALTAVSLSFGQRSPSVTDRIIDEGKNKSQAMSILYELTNDIGPRATGSPQLRAAEDWAVEKFKSWGLTNVHLEQWGETPQGFERGARQSGSMVSPRKKDFVFTTNCWTVGTKGPVTGRAVMMPQDFDEYQKNRRLYVRAWILMPERVAMGGARLTNPTDLDQALDGAGILGRIYTTGQDLVWTHGRWTDYTDATRPKRPLVTVRGEDYDAIVEELSNAGNVFLRFDIENIFHEGEVPISNVVAEIRGSEKPDEVVIVSGHLDSWNGPGSQGASDNGTGTATTMEAARMLMAARARPKRTIRFILWTGEEQGLFGSRDYVRRHSGELDKISCILVEDSGPNYHASISGTADMMPILRAAVAPMADAFEDHPVVANQIRRFSRGGGSDHTPFIQRGVPGFTFGKNGGFSYRRVWHTQYDRYDAVPEDHLIQMATNFAVVAFGIANADELLPRLPRRAGSSARIGG